MISTQQWLEVDYEQTLSIQCTECVLYVRIEVSYTQLVCTYTYSVI